MDLGCSDGKFTQTGVLGGETQWGRGSEMGNKARGGDVQADRALQRGKRQQGQGAGRGEAVGRQGAGCRAAGPGSSWHSPRAGQEQRQSQSQSERRSMAAPGTARRSAPAPRPLAEPRHGAFLLVKKAIILQRDRSRQALRPVRSRGAVAFSVAVTLVSPHWPCQIKLQSPLLLSPSRSSAGKC